MLHVEPAVAEVAWIFAELMANYELSAFFGIQEIIILKEAQLMFYCDTRVIFQ